MKLSDENGGHRGPNLVSMVLTTGWMVWKGRNNFIFKNTPICPNNTIRLIQETCSFSISLECNEDVYHTRKISR